ncbi:MAG: exonuclease SbcC [Bacillota bacterium]|nr:MAG: exonuclease SbcC [Bacillota bacterium]
MRPLRLVVSGLNSFKEEQTVDFTYLCDGNVFGIFGPTGSGKSTLIDAITLALYGRVERAPGKVQGIVNKGTDSASVMFEFELGGVENKAYRVERKYVVKEDNISCRLARISEITAEGSIVLADKVTQVDAKVEEILGLTVDDFTRAVVLPQGKFAEFLSLKGTERREMLERIFNLGEYGERLVNLTSTQYKEVDSDVRSLHSEQAGLGDASKEAVKVAEAALRQSVSEVTATLFRLNNLLAEKEQARVVVDLQHALGAAERNLSVLDGQQDEMSLLKHKLQQLTAAETVEPQVRLYVESEQVYTEARDKLSSAEVQLEKHRLLERERAVAYQKAVNDRQVGEPALTMRLSDLKQAVAIEHKVEELRAIEKRESEVLTQSCGTLEALRDQLKDIGVSERTTEDSLVVLSRELALCIVTPEDRASIERATVSENNWKQAATQEQELKLELDQRQASLSRAQDTLNEAKDKAALANSEHGRFVLSCQELETKVPLEVSAEMRETVSQQRIRLQQVKALAGEHERVNLRRETVRHKLIQLEADSVTEQKTIIQLKNRGIALVQQVYDAEAALERAKQQTAAETLAASLEVGQACPVCGSIEHPAPNRGAEASDYGPLEHDLRLVRDEAQRNMQELASLQARATATAKEKSDVTLSLTEIDSELRRLNKELETSRSIFPTAWIDLFLAELEYQVLSDAEHLERATLERSLWSTRLETERQGERVTRDKLGLANQALALAEQHASTLAREVGAIMDKLKRAEERAYELRRYYDRDLLELGTEDLNGLKTEIAGKDRRYRGHSQTQIELEQRRGELQQSSRELERRLAVEQEAVAVQTTKIESLQVQLSALAQDLYSITEGISAIILCQEVERQLIEFKEAEALCQADLTEARARQEEAGKAMAACLAALEAAEVSCEKALLQMERALESAGFASRELASLVLCDLPYKAQWQQEVQEYMERRAVATADVTKLRSQLAGRAITALEWEGLEQQCLEQKTKYDNDLQRQGQTEARLLDVQHRNLRFEELETLRCTHARQRDMLQEIVSLLRGNALVEFMASEHLHSIAGAATEWLRVLTSHRYGLEVDPDGGFLIRDDGNGGLKRPVHTLSGGETFIASLALALALSAQIQLRGKYPLEFFFLDEGFGTLDPDLLETVMACLERMQGQRMSIGIISHVPELRERIQRKVIVTAAERGGRGSRLRVI